MTPRSGRPRSFGIYTGVLGQELVQTGIPLQDATLDIRHVKDKFPKVKETEWLAERFGTAIAKRRGFTYCRQQHHQRLAGQDQGLVEDGQDRSRKAPSTTATITTTIKLGRLSVITGATSFATAFESDKGGGLRVPALTRLDFHGTQLEYNSAFECPFCRS
ncbi:hypothetical protein ACJZ2D_004013 [Fusarium nematophilum]